MDIMKWLSTSVKNLHWFKTPRGKAAIADYMHEYYEARTDLRDRLKAGYLKKEEYLEWRSLWRSTYQKLSEESRMCSLNRKTSQLTNGAAEQNIELKDQLRFEAVWLMTLRTQSKVIAESSYSKEKELEAA